MIQERRYAWLLRLYPAEYRRARGAELLTTLVESVEDGRGRPSFQEIGALVLGALRAHAGRDCRQSVRDSWWAASRAAAQMLLVYGIAGNGLHLLVTGVPGHFPAERFVHLVALVLGGCAVAAASGSRYRTAAATATAAFVVSRVLAGPMGSPDYGDFLHFPLAIVLLVALSLRRPPLAGGLLRYAPAAPMLLVLATQAGTQMFPEIAGIVTGGLFLGLVLAGLLWLAVDERVTMALGLLFLNSLLIQVAFLAEGGWSLRAVAISVAITAVAPATLLAASAGTARRQARL